MAAITTLLWDNDGVLVDTEPLYLRATQEVLANAGVHIGLEQFLSINIIGGRSAINLAGEAGYSEKEILELRRTRDAHYSELLAQGVELSPGIEQTLAGLAQKFRMAIVTSCPGKHFEIIHRDSGLIRFFDRVIKREDYRRSKPHPDPYLTALSLMNAKPEESLAIEDSPRGLVSATSAGIPCIVHQSSFTKGLAFPGALCFVSSVSEIPDIIASL